MKRRKKNNKIDLRKGLMCIMVICLLINSCKNNNPNYYVDENGLLIGKEYYENGNIKSEQTFTSDTIQEGFYKRYYENGNLEIEIPYKKNKKNGIVKAYYENGRLKSEVNFINGIEDGKAIWYHENGKISSTVNFKEGRENGLMKAYYITGEIEKNKIWEDGVIKGEGYHYYKSGRVKYYMFYERDGNLLYKRSYNEQGNLVKEEGEGTPDRLLNNDTLKKGEILTATFTLVNPPGCEREFYIGDLTSQGKLFNLQKQSLEKESTIFVYTKKYNEAGVYKWGALLKIIDNTTQEISQYVFKMNKLVIEE